MKIEIKREEFLNKLIHVAPGLQTKENLEQSGCFFFKNKKVMTYSEGVFCSMNLGFPEDGEFVVASEKLLALLQKMPDDLIRLKVTDNLLIVSGVNSERKASFPKDSEISPTAGIDRVEKPDKWKTLHSKFCDAILIGSECAKKSSSYFFLICAHVTPKYIESTDNDQVVRYRIKTGIEEDCLLEKSSLVKLAQMMPTKMSETESWLHFRNGTGLTFSIKKHPNENFPNVKPVLEMKGTKIKLNKGISLSSDLASIFTKSPMKGGVSREKILVSMRKGEMEIVGEGSGGTFKEKLKFKYKGPEFQFTVSPKLFSELTRKTSECEIEKRKLKVDANNFTYIACLLDPEAMKKQLNQEETNEKESESED